MRARQTSRHELGMARERPRQWLQRAATDGSVLARRKCECMPVARACMTLIEFDMPRDAREVGGRLCVRPDCRWYGRPAHSARTTY
jgi:hypothetical protein